MTYVARLFRATETVEIFGRVMTAGQTITLPVARTLPSGETVRIPVAGAEHLIAAGALIEVIRPPGQVQR